VQVSERIESIDLCSVHAPGIQAVADRIHEGCGDLEREPFLGRERQLGNELMIGGGKGVEDKGPMQEGRRNAVYRARRQVKD
jgi:hypothetical protein